MSQQEHDRGQAGHPQPGDQETAAASRSGGFAPDTAEALPKLQVADLPEDATGLSPEVMAGQVPTLTDPVDPASPVVAQMASPEEPSKAPPSDIDAQTIPVLTRDEMLALIGGDAGQAPAPEPAAPQEALPESAPQPQEDAAAQAVAVPAVVPAEGEADPVEAVASPVEEPAQEPPVAVESFSQRLQARMGKLGKDINALKDRLDQLEKLPKA